MFKHVVFNDFHAETIQFCLEVATGPCPRLIYKTATIRKEITVWTTAEIENLNFCSQGSIYLLLLLKRFEQNPNESVKPFFASPSRQYFMQLNPLPLLRVMEAKPATFMAFAPNHRIWD